MANDKPKKLVSAAEEDKISRAMLVWLNTWPDKPVDVIRYEFLPADSEGAMALSTIQGTYITRRYILGGHQAEYQFKVIYRLKPGNSNDKRLKADELLDSLADWAADGGPDAWKPPRAPHCSAHTTTATRIIRSS
mgnify:CR=1 FL=1